MKVVRGFGGLLLLSSRGWKRRLPVCCQRMGCVRVDWKKEVFSYQVQAAPAVLAPLYLRAVLCCAVARCFIAQSVPWAASQPTAVVRTDRYMRGSLETCVAYSRPRPPVNTPHQMRWMHIRYAQQQQCCSTQEKSKSETNGHAIEVKAEAAGHAGSLVGGAEIGLFFIFLQQYFLRLFEA